GQGLNEKEPTMSVKHSRRSFLAVTAGAAGAVPILASAQGVTSRPAAPDMQNAAVAAPAGGYVQPTGEGRITIGSLEDLEGRAAQVIPAGAFAYIAAGADNQITLRDNRAAFDRIRLLPQYLVGKSAPNLSTEL